jgi:outer membrane protein assembly factor BamB
MKKIILFYLVIPLIAMALTFGCSKKKPEEKIETIEPVEEVAKAPEPLPEEPLEEPTEEEREIAEIEREIEEKGEVLTSGVVVYASGDVSVDRGAGWEMLDVDDCVELSHRVKTEAASFCEIQFADFGIIRIQEKTEIAISQVYLKEDQNKVRVKLDEGKLLCKVNKLTKGEEFQVRTATALAGVRGTEFMVTTKPDKSVHFAVKEGTVAVVPVAVADKLEEIKKDLKSDTAKEFLEEIAVPEIILTDEKEVTLQQEEVQKAAQEFEAVSNTVEQKIQKIDEKARVVEKKEKIVEAKGEAATERDKRQILEIKEDIAELKEEVISVTTEKAISAQKVLHQPAAISRPVIQELGEIEKMETKEFVIAALVTPKEERKEEKPVYTKVIVEAVPGDATIYINGDKLGKGRFSGLYLPSTELTIRIEKKGYITEEKKIGVLELETQTITFELEHSPLSWRVKIGSTPYIRKIVTSGERIVIADAAGKVSCFNSNGDNLWTVTTNNKPNNNSMPVIIGNEVLFSGSKELAVIQLRTGKEIKRLPIGKGNYSSHIFGRRVVDFDGSVLYPSNTSLLLLEPESLIEKSSIQLPETTHSSPAIYKNRILIVDQKGALLKIDPDSGKIDNRIQSNAIQPVSSAPVIVGDAAVFAGRDGLVVYADLLNNEVVWEQKIDLGKGMGIFQDITASDKGVYPYTGTLFHALARENGAVLFKPVLSTCSPLYNDGKLFYGDNEGNFVVLDALTGQILKKYPLESTITLEPAVYEGEILIATKSGTIYRLNPEYM